MEFFDREEELLEVKQLEKTGSRMLVIYGKRRVGKTAIIKEFFRTSKAKKLYFFVPRNEKINNIVREYANLVKTELNLKEYEKIENMSDLVKILLEYSKRYKIIIAMDEFQNFKYVYPEAIDILQREWDMRDYSTNLSLVISGSIVGMMKSIFSEDKAPLFKRAYNMLEIKEFSLENAFRLMEKLEVKSFEDKMKIYFLFGGVVFYYSLIDYYGANSFDKVIEKLIVSPVAPLKNPVKEDMIEAFGNKSATYFAILEAIASGRNTNNEVAAYAQIKETSLSQYIYDLKYYLGVVDTATLPTVNFKPGSKKNRLIITDSFYRFWFNAISSNYSYYEINDMAGLSAKISEALQVFFGSSFEIFSHEFIKLLSKRGRIFHIDKVGNWRGKNQEKQKGFDEEEIDAVAVDKKAKEILFAECKWTSKQIGIDVYENLKRKSKLVQWNNEVRKEHFALFSRSGFTGEMRELAKKENVMLFDLETIEKELKS
ncbi:MAG: ATP-binding protein [Candidatus Micrarchaeia archaeon]